MIEVETIQIDYSMNRKYLKRMFDNTLYLMRENRMITQSDVKELTEKLDECLSVG